MPFVANRETSYAKKVAWVCRFERGEIDGDRGSGKALEVDECVCRLSCYSRQQVDEWGAVPNLRALRI